MIKRILFWLQNFEDEIREGGWVEYYRAHASCLGSAVTVIKGENRASATALDIDADGGLLVTYENDIQEVLRGGEISLRIR